jgi:hypothetical protein
VVGGRVGSVSASRDGQRESPRRRSTCLQPSNCVSVCTFPRAVIRLTSTFSPSTCCEIAAGHIITLDRTVPLTVSQSRV